jgi:hypothetical protein
MRTLKLSAVLMSIVVLAACPDKADNDSELAPSSATVPSGVAPAAAAAPPAPTPVPTPEAAVAVVEQFYGQYTGKLTPALTALFTDAQRARAEALTKQCSTVKDGELPAACESDPYICAQDDVKMGKPTFQAPGTVVVAATEFPDLKVTLALKDVGGTWKIDGFTCPAP